MKKAASLASFAALGLLGAVLAYWTWAWLAPRPLPRAPAFEAAQGTSAAALFGAAKHNQGGAAAASGAIRLMGVAAASGGRRGHAVLRLDGKRTVAVLQGEDVEPGLRLAEIHADHVVLERNGAPETLAWPQKQSR